MTKTYGEALRDASCLLESRGIPDAGPDAWYIMSEVSGFSRAVFWAREDLAMPEEKLETYLKMIDKRAAHVPLQHILGEQDFCGLSFTVNPDVLVPRQDTEVLVEKCVDLARGRRVLDLCTGSGCILISLAVLAWIKSGVGADISEKALLVARANMEKNSESLKKAGDPPLGFVKSDLFEHVEGEFDLIVSNPPYIRSGEIEGLMEEVRDHEPRLALDGGEDGLYFYRRIVKEAKGHLSADGAIAFEIGCDQRVAVEEILRENGFRGIRSYRDLAGLDRVVTGYVREA
ncbi:MAG: peptide chain release factor N(5)-glutamine methyltransferase [Lachnospiraceae bacterium]|nr:peptide chain release factor N(5)-glutamine methyltransferase [Lachnospiraceae bacterium]